MAGAHHQTPAQKANSARIVALNKTNSTYFAFAVCGVIAVFAVFHFGRLYANHHHQRARGKLAVALAAPFRFARRFLVVKVPRFSSAGHAVVVLVYAGVNAGLTFYDVEWTPVASKYSFFSKRCGWMCVCNMGLALLLAMKNTPLGFLTGYSHERLNVLHRWTGRTTWLYACLHVVTYTTTLFQQSNLAKLHELPQVYGYVAFGAFNIMAISSIQPIRKRLYELFYLLHITFFLVAIIFTALHKPLKFQWAAIGVAIIFLVDKTIRTIRRCWYSWGNSATLIPLPGLATRIIFKHPVASTPGSHAFISIPSLRKFQSHPFTIASVDNVEFVVKAQEGFTLDLHKLALHTPGVQVRAWFDGPYGAVPDFKNKDAVVLFAGGSGAAFLFPVALDVARNAGRCRVQRVEAVWAVRDERCLAWYKAELDELRDSKIVNVSIYITSGTDQLTTSQPIEREEEREEAVRMSMDVPVSKVLTEGSEVEGGLVGGFSAAVGKEFGLTAGTAAVIDEKPARRYEVRVGRPDIAALVAEVVATAESSDLVAVGACGPTELMRVARNAVASNIKFDGPSVSLHCEQFGWG